jgi:hypothetical protein
MAVHCMSLVIEEVIEMLWSKEGHAENFPSP